MIVLPQTVTLKWNGKNKAHLESKGYVFTSKGAEVVVSVEHLQRYSSTKVHCKCDGCNISKIMTLNRYHRHIDSSGEYLCYRCWVKTVQATWEEVFLAFYKRGYIILDRHYTGTAQKLMYYCRKHNFQVQYLSYNSFKYGYGCIFCGREAGAKKTSGENNKNWKGGISEVVTEFRRYVYPWRRRMLKAADRTCDITGVRGGVIVHHLIPFIQLLNEVHDEMGLIIMATLGDYTVDQRQEIRRRLLEKHFNLKNVGVVMSKALHTKFHSEYGVFNNTAEQYEEFKQKYKP